MAFGITTFAEAPFAATGSSNATAAVTGIQFTRSVGASICNRTCEYKCYRIQLTGSIGSSTIA